MHVLTSMQNAMAYYMNAFGITDVGVHLNALTIRNLFVIKMTTDKWANEETRSRVGKEQVADKQTEKRQRKSRSITKDLSYIPDFSFFRNTTDCQ